MNAKKNLLSKVFQPNKTDDSIVTENTSGTITRKSKKDLLSKSYDVNQIEDINQMNKFYDSSENEESLEENIENSEIVELSVGKDGTFINSNFKDYSEYVGNSLEDEEISFANLPDNDDEIEFIEPEGENIEESTFEESIVSDNINVINAAKNAIRKENSSKTKSIEVEEKYNEINQKNNEIEENNDEIEELENKIIEINKNLNKLNSILNEKKESLNKYSKALNSKNIEVDQIDLEIDEIKEKLEETDNNLNLSKENLNSLKNSLKVSKRELTKSQNFYNKLEKESEQIEEDIAQISKQIEEKQGNLNSRKQEANNLNKKLEDLENSENEDIIESKTETNNSLELVQLNDNPFRKYESIIKFSAMNLIHEAIENNISINGMSKDGVKSIYDYIMFKIES